MNREDIIKMAQEAGIDAEKDTLCRYEGWVEPLERFFHAAYAAGAAAEREACAKVCEETGKEPDDHKAYEGYAEGYQDGSNNCAASIRARGNP